MRIVWDNSRLDLTGSTQKNERKSTAQLGNPMCHVWAESIKTRSGEVSELTESNGDPSGLKGLGTSSRTSLRQTALGFRSYHSSASAGQSTIKNHGAKNLQQNNLPALKDEISLFSTTKVALACAVITIVKGQSLQGCKNKVFLGTPLIVTPTFRRYGQSPLTPSTEKNTWWPPTWVQMGCMYIQKMIC